MTKTLTLLAFAFFLFSTKLHAQPELKKPAKQCDEHTALQLVEQQAIESKSMTESDKRINILIRVADYVWSKNNESSRKYFLEAFKLASVRFTEKGLVNTSTEKFSFKSDPDYRFIVLRAVAKRDPLWARKLTEELLKDFDEDASISKREPFQQARELSNSLDLGISLLDSAPSIAIPIIRRLINYPLFIQWHNGLYQISAKDPLLAERIYSELLSKHSNSSVQKLLILSAFPFGRPNTIEIGSYSSGNTIPAGFVPNVTLQRNYLTLLLRKVRSLTPDNILLTDNPRATDAGYGVFALTFFSPIINSNFQDLANHLVQATANANALMDSETRKNLESGTEFNKTSSMSFQDRIDDLDIKDSKGLLRDFDIVTLISAAKSEADLKLLEPWLDKIKDQTVKEKSINFFYFNSSKMAVKEKRLDDARKFADKVPQIEFRAILYFDIADEKLKQPLEKYESFEILSEVFRIAEKAPDSVEKAQVLMGVGFMFEKIDHANSIEAISKSIRTANKLENPNLFTSSVTHQITGENFGTYTSYSVPGFDINKAFDQISKTDFQGAISLAEDFTDKYLRTVAVLASVKECKSNVPNKEEPVQNTLPTPTL